MNYPNPADIARDTFYSPIRFREILEKYGYPVDWERMRQDILNNRFVDASFPIDDYISDTRQWVESENDKLIVS